MHDQGQKKSFSLVKISPRIAPGSPPDRPPGSGQGPRLLYALHDIQYNVLGLVDEDGDLVERYEYGAYGQRSVYIPTGDADRFPDEAGYYACTYKAGTSQRASTGGTGGGTTYGHALNPIGFQGLYHDEETASSGSAAHGGIIHNRHRAWHTTLGRFNQRDPLGYPDGLNAYAGYHVMHGGVDPSGTVWFFFRPSKAELDALADSLEQQAAFHRERAAEWHDVLDALYQLYECADECERQEIQEHIRIVNQLQSRDASRVRNLTHDAQAVRSGQRFKDAQAEVAWDGTLGTLDAVVDWGSMGMVDSVGGHTFDLSTREGQRAYAETILTALDYATGFPGAGRQAMRGSGRQIVCNVNPRGGAGPLPRISPPAPGATRNAPDMTSRAARRQAMREQGIPTSRPPTSQSGREGRRQYVVEGHDGSPRVVTQHPADSRHPNPHWHASTPRPGDPMPRNRHGQIKYQSGGSVVGYSR